jgi:multiple sugar transport system ATP-binding protein
VAGFIGSPQMNFIEVEIVSQNKVLYLRANGLAIPLLDKFKDKVSNLSDKRNYILGIRPEHIYVTGRAQIDLFI